VNRLKNAPTRSNLRVKRCKKLSSQQIASQTLAQISNSANEQEAAAYQINQRIEAVIDAAANLESSWQSMTAASSDLKSASMSLDGIVKGFRTN